MTSGNDRSDGCVAHVMTRPLIALLVACQSYAAPAPPPPLAAELGFETVLTGWFGGPAGTAFSDAKVVHRAHSSARLDRDSKSPGQLSALTHVLPLDVQGATLELCGYLRTEGVHGEAALWLREDG